MLRIKLFGQAFMEMIAVVGSAMLLLVGGTQGKLGYLTTMDAWGRSMGVSPLGGFGELMLMAFVLTVLWLPVRMLFSGKGEGGTGAFSSFTRG